MLVVLLCTATLLLKLLVPTGYMIGIDHGHIAIIVCPGVVPTATAMAMPGMHHDATGHGKSSDHGKAEMPCAFAGLSAAMTGAIDPIQLAALIAFVIAIGLGGVVLPAPFAPTHLRPPLRGPPRRL